MIILGITGFKQCGKNHAASYLEKHFGFKVYAFADTLRSMAVAVNPMISLGGITEELRNDLCDHPLRVMWRNRDAMRYNDILLAVGYEKAKEVPDLRTFLQKLGTEAVRDHLGYDVWVNALALRLQREQPERAVIADVRFHNEVAWIYSQGGEVWRVHRPGHGGVDEHPSEKDIPWLRVSCNIHATSAQELEEQVHFLAFESSLLERQ